MAPPRSWPATDGPAPPPSAARATGTPGRRRRPSCPPRPRRRWADAAMEEAPPVGIVVVSHSRALGTAAAELAREVVGTDVPIAVAAGIDDTTSGTDAA